MVTRNQIFQWFRKENEHMEEQILIAIFKSMTDEKLANMYGLKILRKGYFYR